MCKSQTAPARSRSLHTCGVIFNRAVFFLHQHLGHACAMCLQGSVAKITGKEGLHFKGPALVYDCEEDMLAALERKEITKGDAYL